MASSIIKVNIRYSMCVERMGLVSHIYCKGGSCISMDKRCDQFPNCPDFSDEDNCNLVVKTDSYVKDFTPFTLDDEDQISKVPILITVQ